MNANKTTHESNRLPPVHIPPLRQCPSEEHADVVSSSASSVLPELVCGVMGGMGSEATLDFIHKCLSLTRSLYPATSDAFSDGDHISLVIELNPKIPNRISALQRGVPEELAAVSCALRSTASKLSTRQVDFAVAVCNTAHAFESDIVAGLDGVPFVSIVKLVCSKARDLLAARHGFVDPPLSSISFPSSSSSSSSTPPTSASAASIPRLLILATSGCLSSGLYQSSLSTSLGPLATTSCLPPSLQSRLDSAVYAAKRGDAKGGAETLLEAGGVAEYLKAEADAVVLGCTELPLVFAAVERMRSWKEGDKAEGNWMEGIIVLDSTAILAEAVVDLCKRRRRLEDVLSGL